MHDAGETSLWFRFAIAALATWRLTHLLALEDGPFDLVARARGALGRAGRVLDCFYCLSIWIAAPLALFVSTRLVVWLCVWPALSAVACIVHRASEPAAVAAPILEEDLPPRPAKRGEVAGRRPAGEGSVAATDHGRGD